MYFKICMSLGNSIIFPEMFFDPVARVLSRPTDHNWITGQTSVKINVISEELQISVFIGPRSDHSLGLALEKGLQSKLKFAQELSKLLYGFVKVDAWICQDVTCTSCPLTKPTKLKFDQDFEACCRLAPPRECQEDGESDVKVKLKF